MHQRCCYCPHIALEAIIYEQMINTMKIICLDLTTSTQHIRKLENVSKH